jgi:hypothetical protein
MAATAGDQPVANTRAAASVWAAAVEKVVVVAVGEVAVVEEVVVVAVGEVAVVEEVVVVAVGEVAVVEEVVLPLLPRCPPPARSSHPRSPILQKPRTVRRIRQYHRNRPRITQNTPYSWTL